MSGEHSLIEIDEVLAGTWDKLKTQLPEHFTVPLTDVHISRIGRKLLGLPVEPRASRGYRRHIRRVKARKA